MTETSDKILSVRMSGREIGILSQNKGGKMEFKYSHGADFAISKSLPVSDKLFKESECRPFFNGLLPESEETRQKLGRMFAINHRNDFSLLKAIGHDCAGALYLAPREEPLIKGEFLPVNYKEAEETELEQCIKNLPRQPFFTSANNDIRLSLAGAQDKAAVVYFNGRVAFPSNKTPTTHILKAEIKNLEDTLVNEYFCMKLAAKVDIKTPSVEIKQAGNTKYLLIERYDRLIKDGLIKRIHQEDCCQASGILSLYKYQKEGGPNLKQSFALLQSTATFARNKIMMMRRIMFNFLTGNNDAHSKNFSILYDTPKGSLAPAYDLISTEVYGDLSKNMAMSIGGCFDKGRLSARDFEKMCKDADYNFSIFKREVKVFTGKVLLAADNLSSDGTLSGSAVPRKIINIIKENAAIIEKLF